MQISKGEFRREGKRFLVNVIYYIFQLVTEKCKLKIIEAVNSDGSSLLVTDCNFTWIQGESIHFIHSSRDVIEINPFPLLVRRKEQKP